METILLSNILWSSRMAFADFFHICGSKFRTYFFCNYIFWQRVQNQKKKKNRTSTRIRTNIKRVRYTRFQSSVSGIFRDSFPPCFLVFSRWNSQAILSSGETAKTDGAPVSSTFKSYFISWLFWHYHPPVIPGLMLRNEWCLFAL